MNKLLLALLFTLYTVSGSFASEVNLYSSRHYKSDVELYKKFTAKTGIKVNVVKAKYKVLEKRLLSEGKDSKADVVITVDAGALGSATNKGIFQKIKSDALNSKIPSNFRSKHWYGIAKRARLIYYNPETLSPEIAKNLNYEDLANPIFKKRVVIRKSSNVYNQSLVSSLVDNLGKTNTSKWAKGLVANMARKPKGNDRAQILAVAAGEADLAVANSYYIALMLSGKKGPEQQAAAKKVRPVFPNQNNRGTHMNISGGGVAKYAPNKENAIKFLEFLLTKEAQQHIVNNTFEYPMIDGVKPNKLISQFGTSFKQDTNTKVTVYYKNQAKALSLMKKAGW
jgi:iron(III) transport system substrate-binding protein